MWALAACRSIGVSRMGQCFENLDLRMHINKQHRIKFITLLYSFPTFLVKWRLVFCTISWLLFPFNRLWIMQVEQIMPVKVPK